MAQKPVPAPATKSETMILLKVGGGFYKSAGILGQRYPHFAGIPVAAYLKTSSNLTFGIDFMNFLGSKVNTTGLLQGINGSSGNVLDQNGFPTVIRYYMRGYTLTGTAGKLFKVNNKNPQLKLQTQFGLGFMQHKTRMQLDAGRSPQVEGEYQEGYDRLTNGLQLTQTLRLHYVNTETLSVFAGVDLSQGFTRNQRNWDYGFGNREPGRRLDTYFGISAGILIPITLRSSTREPGYM
ncbi:MAG: hypothetical protein JNL57_11070 [Bacteroidetes bacterium]|nr:hypothetical protein [Bacteroidota bacterium]